MTTIYATWKNQLNHEACVSLAKQMVAIAPDLKFLANVTVFPPMVSLAAVAAILRDSFSIGAQNVIWNAPYALTGETKASTLASMGCSIVMVGHSERRVHLGETDAQVVLKAEAVLEQGMSVLVCIGETYEERQQGATKKVLASQLAGFRSLLKTSADPTRIVFAYEPAWAITTNLQSLPANPELAAEDHRYIRAVLRELAPEVETKIRIAYGAGVNSGNVASFLATPEVDGVLAGGASQELGRLIALLKAASTHVKDEA